MKLPNFLQARAAIRTSADVLAETGRHRTLLADAQTELAALDASRHEVLISDETAVIREHERRSAELRMACDRLDARLIALDVQAAEIAAAEAAAALTVRRTAAEARAVEIVKWWRDSYPDLARLLIGAMTELREADAEISAVNAALISADRQAEELRGAEDRINPHSMTEAPGVIFVPRMPIGANTRLVELEAIGAPGWGQPLGDFGW